MARATGLLIGKIYVNWNFLYLFLKKKRNEAYLDYIWSTVGDFLD